MKRLLFLILLVSSSLCQAQRADEGDYVVLRGALLSCVQWSGRVLDVVQIENADPIQILGLPPVYILGLSPEQITRKLEDHIDELTGVEPTSIRIEILKNQAAYRTIVFEYARSWAGLIQGDCASLQPRNRSRQFDWQPPPSIDKQMRRIYRLDAAVGLV
jgi:hypothetical protein